MLWLSSSRRKMDRIKPSTWKIQIKMKLDKIITSNRVLYHRVASKVRACCIFCCLFFIYLWMSAHWNRKNIHTKYERNCFRSCFARSPENKPSSFSWWKCFLETGALGFRTLWFPSLASPASAILEKLNQWSQSILSWKTLTFRELMSFLSFVKLNERFLKRPWKNKHRLGWTSCIMLASMYSAGIKILVSVLVGVSQNRIDFYDEVNQINLSIRVFRLFLRRIVQWLKTDRMTFSKWVFNFCFLMLYELLRINEN